MAFLNKLSDMARNIGDKAGVTTETTKLNSKINSETAAIDGVYKKMGEYYYQQHKSGVKLPKEAAAFCAEIDGRNTAINEAKAEIERMKVEGVSESEIESESASDVAAEGVACPSCNKMNAPGTKFCQECGTKLEVPDKRNCSCGAEIAPGVRFCSECGAKIE